MAAPPSTKTKAKSATSKKPDISKSKSGSKKAAAVVSSADLLKKKNTKAAVKAASSESDDDSDSSDSEAKKALSKKSKSAPPKAAQKDDTSSSSEDDNDSDSSSSPAPKGLKRTTEESSDDESESDSDDEPSKSSVATPAPAKKSTLKTPQSSESSSDSSSDSEAKTPTAKSTAVKRPASSSSDSDSSEDSDSDDESDPKMKVDAPVTNGTKRKAEVAPATSKKVKLENGAAAPVQAATNGSDEEVKSIFVGRLSWNVDNEWLASEFSSCGEVVSATVQMDRNTGKPRGFGYVHFADSSSVAKALEMNGKEIDGRPVNIDKGRPVDKERSKEVRAKTFGDTVSAPSAVLFVGNLSFNTNEDQIWEAFGAFGNVSNVRLPTDRETGRPKGFGYVEFEEMEGAKKAFEGMAGKDIDGRAIRLDYSQPRDNNGGSRGGARGGGRGRGGFGGDRGFGGGRGGGRGGGGRGRGGRGGGRGGSARTGAFAPAEGKKITFD